MRLDETGSIGCMISELNVEITISHCGFVQFYTNARQLHSLIAVVILKAAFTHCAVCRSYGTLLE